MNERNKPVMKMNPKLFQAVQEAFPRSRVGILLGDEVSIVLTRGHMRTIYKPDPALLEKDATEELIQQVLDEIYRAHNEVDAYYEQIMEDLGSQRV